MTIFEFIEQCRKRPIPKNRMDQVRLFVEELVEGVLEKVWEQPINTKGNNYSNYVRIRWQENHPPPIVAEQLRYIDIENHSAAVGNNKYERDVPHLEIREKAYLLFDENRIASPTRLIPVFISYKRSESSAFALLIERELKSASLSPFLDKQLQPGDNWHGELEHNIKNADYFIVLLGNETLHSEVTVKEIQWALEGNIPIIPIWHNGFEFKAQEWTKLTVEVSQALLSTHTIRVLEENPLTYDTALRELLNRFGIST